MSRFTRADDIRIILPKRALEVVFDECDRYDADETGGRVLGTYSTKGSELVVRVNGIIEPGPNAKRTATYFQQDGAYQESVFRRVEDLDASVEHLGNWHTHHVNGLRHLSGGDIETYRRTVEHEKHNTEFFYALLVIERKPGKTGLQRYIFKNYVLRRSDPNVYEIPGSALTLTDEPLLWPSDRVDEPKREAVPQDDPIKTNRLYDKDAIAQFFPEVRLFQSKELGLYWRGAVLLLDGSAAEMIVVEGAKSKVPEFSLSLRSPPEQLETVARQLGEQTYPSARAALIGAERACNAAIFAAKKKRKGKRLWIF